MGEHESERALRDLRDIFAYTLATWGERQLADYRAKIDAAVRSIAQDPNTGRDSIKPGLKVIPVGKHRLFYRNDGTAGFVIRILHERMDVARHLGESNS